MGVCTISLKPVGGFSPNLCGYIFGQGRTEQCMYCSLFITCKRLDRLPVGLITNVLTSSGGLYELLVHVLFKSISVICGQFLSSN